MSSTAAPKTAPSKPRGFRPGAINPKVQKADEEIQKALATHIPEGSQLAPAPVAVPYRAPTVPPRQPSEQRVLVTAKSAKDTALAASAARIASVSAATAAATPKQLKLPEDESKRATKLSMVKKPVAPTPDYKPSKKAITGKLQGYIEKSALLSQYYKGQEATETNNPYLTDTVIYTPDTRKSFYRFIDDNYDKFKLKAMVNPKIDEEACSKLGSSAQGQVESFLYQKFIREYVRQASPYRGILVYHGLGSGKTCSSIAAAEALYGTSQKRIIVMTPFSLRANFMSEVSFCGFKHFNLNNHWVKQKLFNQANPLSKVYIKTFATNVLSISEDFYNKLERREDQERRCLWIIDFNKSDTPNYESLTQQERDDVRAQVTNMIENRITFINYNGIQAKKLKEMACTTDKDGNRFFDNAVIVIDEVHNLTRLMQGTIVPYMTERFVGRQKRKRRIPVEPVVPGKWVPGQCVTDNNYKRAYLFYKLLSDARNSKIIGLSGTPLINFPEEIGILANVLAGYMECVEFTIGDTKQETIDKFVTLAEKELRIDIIKTRPANRVTRVLLSTFGEGYEKVLDAEKENEFIGVKYNEEAQENIRDIFPRIKEAAKALQIPVLDGEQYVSYPRLPPDEETFRGTFIGPDMEIKNINVLRKRLTGLISYYKGSKDEYMPRVIKDEVVKCELSDYALSKYIVERKREIEGEIGKEKGDKSDDVFATVETFSKMKNPSSYRFRSRALCNFAFPKGIDRPFPDSQDEIEEEAAAIPEEIDMAEAQLDPEADLEAAKIIEAEEATIPPPEDEQAPLSDFEANQVEGAAPATTAAQQGGEDSNEENENSDMNSIDRLLAEEAASSNDNNSSSTSSSENSIDRLLAEAAASSNEESNEESNNEEEEMNSNEEELLKSMADPAPAPVAVAPAPVAPAAVAVAAKPATGKPATGKPPIGKPPIGKTVVATPVTAPAAAEAAVAAVAPVVAAKPVRRGPPIGKLPAAVAAVAAAAPVAPVEAPKEELESVGAVEDAEQAAAVGVVRTYQERIRNAMNRLYELRDKYLTLNPSSEDKLPLSNCSMKLDAMLRRIMVSKGSNLVYSQFKTVEGLGVLGLALKANGFSEIVIQGSDLDPEFSPETIESFQQRPNEKRFILFTGEGTRERRGLILNVFNGNYDKLPEKMRRVLLPTEEDIQAQANAAEAAGNDTYVQKADEYADKNKFGKICWVIGITGAGAEGISLKCCRSVHIMEPYWNNVRLDQVKGRAIRICSHMDLPYAQRNVEIYTYISCFSREQLQSADKIDFSIKQSDDDMTSDEKVYDVSVRKDAINQKLLDLMKQVSTDCDLNAADNGEISCFRIDGRPDQYMFDPVLGDDIISTSMETLEVKTGLDEVIDAAAVVEKKTGEVKQTSATTQVPVIELDEVQYMLREVQGSGGLEFYLHLTTDTRMMKPVGTISRDPTDPESFIEPVFY
jgi:hypothetical protein